MAVAALVAAACAFASVRRFLRVAQGPGADVLRWASSLEARTHTARSERLQAAAQSDAGLAELVAAIETAPSRDAALAEIDDRALELGRVLSVGAAIPISAARISMFTGTACAIGVVAAARADPSALATALTSFALGLTGGISAVVLGRLASVRAREQREAWQRLSRSLESLAERTQK